MFGLIGRIILRRMVLLARRDGDEVKEGRMGVSMNPEHYCLLCGICPWRDTWSLVSYLGNGGGFGSGTWRENKISLKKYKSRCELIHAVIVIDSWSRLSFLLDVQYA